MDSQETSGRGSPQALKYRVPHGQDPVAVLTALTGAGYDARPSQPPDTNAVVVLSYAPESDREAVRSVIAEVHSTQAEGPANLDPRPVRFDDERRD